jgi:hypothetical protein
LVCGYAFAVQRIRIGKVLVNPKVFPKLNIVLISNKKYPEKLLKGAAKSQISLIDQGFLN